MKLNPEAGSVEGRIVRILDEFEVILSSRSGQCTGVCGNHFNI
jgi:hypothetical protein